mgnify:CR=1 FL=1
MTTNIEAELCDIINNNHMKLIEVKTDKKVALPKKFLTLREFNAIRSNFQGSDFERNSILPASIFVTSAVLWFT